MDDDPRDFLANYGRVKRRFSPRRQVFMIQPARYKVRTWAPSASQSLFEPANDDLPAFDVPPPPKSALWMRIEEANLLASCQRVLEASRGRPPPAHRRKIVEILAETAAEFKVSVEDLVGARRLHKFVEARHHAVWRICMERPDLTYRQIGLALGGRDHSTILHAFHRIDEAHRRAHSRADYIDLVRHWSGMTTTEAARHYERGDRPQEDTA